MAKTETAQEIVAELKALGSESTKKTLLNHGIKEPVLGVKIADLKPIQKRIKRNYQLALELYDTGIYDAMYLAGLIADDAKMTQSNLQHWVENATSESLCGYTVAWVAAESSHGREMARAWIDSSSESIAATGWSTLGSLVSIKSDSDLDLTELKQLLGRVEATIHDQPNRVRHAMNGFLIAVGCYVAPLTELVVQTAMNIDKVAFDPGKTACKLPSVIEYIQKVQKRGAIGKKRKTAKC